MVVRSESSGKREMRRMPDFPAVNFAQLSSLPTPSEVTTPMPVMAMTGRPALSRFALGLEAALGFAEDAAMVPPFNSPVRAAPALRRANCHTGDDDLGQAGRTFPGIARPRRGEQPAVLDRRAADTQIGHELGIDAMPDIRTGIADGKANLLKHGPF